MARKQKAIAVVENEAGYIKGVAKNLVDRLYGPAGPPWGTKFTELEDTVAAIRELLTEEMLQQALGRQAAHDERPPEYNVCPGCGRAVQPTGVTEQRWLETGSGEAVWEEPKTRCQQCRRDFFPSEQELGH
jgi:hypothetical protein